MQTSASFSAKENTRLHPKIKSDNEDHQRATLNSTWVLQNGSANQVAYESNNGEKISERFGKMKASAIRTKQSTFCLCRRQRKHGRLDCLHGVFFVGCLLGFVINCHLAHYMIRDESEWLRALLLQQGHHDPQQQESQQHHDRRTLDSSRLPAIRSGHAVSGGSTTNSGAAVTFFSQSVFFDAPLVRNRYIMWDVSNERQALVPDLGGLQLESKLFVLEQDFYRSLDFAADIEQYERSRSAFLDEIDGYVSSRYYGLDDIDYQQTCVKPQWAYSQYPVCNLFHELSTDENALARPDPVYEIEYLAHGHYRDAWVFRHLGRVIEPTKDPETGYDSVDDGDDESDFVLKRYRVHKDIDPRAMNLIRSEAVVLERLSASDRTIDMYGHCGLSIMVQNAGELTYHIVPERSREYQPEERGRMPQNILDGLQVGDVHPMNNLTVLQKLEIAIAMAEGMAEMHGFVGGTIVNDDIHPDQWLITSKGRVILNDMNNAQILSWNADNGKYCKYWTSFPAGRFRAPEEYSGDYVDESADIWPMGNLLFSLLTGLYPYYRQTDKARIQQTSRKGIPPYIDPRYSNRSLIERRMVEVMQRCHKLKPIERIDIFGVVRHLRHTAWLYNQEQGR